MGTRGAPQQDSPDFTAADLKVPSLDSLSVEDITSQIQTFIPRVIETLNAWLAAFKVYQSKDSEYLSVVAEVKKVRQNAQASIIPLRDGNAPLDTEIRREESALDTKVEAETELIRLRFKLSGLASDLEALMTELDRRGALSGVAASLEEGDIFGTIESFARQVGEQLERFKGQAEAAGLRSLHLQKSGVRHLGDSRDGVNTIDDVVTSISHASTFVAEETDPRTRFAASELSRTGELRTLDEMSRGRYFKPRFPYA